MNSFKFLKLESIELLKGNFNFAVVVYLKILKAQLKRRKLESKGNLDI